MNAALHLTLAQLFAPAVLRTLLDGLCSRFPGLCPGHVEDAIQTAAFELLRSPTALQTAWSQGGAPRVRQVLVVASWRQCLRQIRGGAARHERLLDVAPEAAHDDTPEDALISSQLLAQVEGLIAQAARRFGGPRAEAMGEALRERLGGDETDIAVARRHDVHRESLNRAKNWLADRLPRG